MTKKEFTTVLRRISYLMDRGEILFYGSKGINEIKDDVIYLVGGQLISYEK